MHIRYLSTDKAVLLPKSFKISVDIMDEFILLNSHSLQNFRKLIPNKIHEQIVNNPSIHFLVVGAIKEHLSTGICIASLDSYSCHCDFLHIEVLKEHQNQHLGRRLLAKTQDIAVSRGVKVFTLNYALDDDSTPAIKKILVANQWQGSRPFLIRGFFNPATFNAPIVRMNYQFPPDYKEFLWKNIKDNQRSALMVSEKQKQFPAIFSPFREQQIQEKLNSLGLSYKNRIIGWLITHRIDSDTIRYSCLYIESQFKFRGLAMKLLADSMKIHIQNPTKVATIEIPYLQVHSNWIRFIERRILPYAVKVSYLEQGWHTIS